MNSNKILVTGAAGFIGYHVCIKLLEEGYSVIGIDNLNSYYDVDLKNARLKEIEEFISRKNHHGVFIKVIYQTKNRFLRYLINVSLKSLLILLHKQELDIHS